jgi:expansin (peptidoglycan-binding protein)
MRFENVPLRHVLIAAGALSLMACSASTPPEEQVSPLSDERPGVAIRIASDGTGNCNFDASPEDLNIAALSPAEYGQSEKCGGCAELAGPNKQKVIVRIVDSCSGCTVDQMGLTPQVFDAMGAGDLQQTGISWRYTSCPVQGPVRYRFKEDSNPYWVAIQVRNHLLPITKLEWQKDGTWLEVHREAYNYFVEPSGMGPGPIQVRVTASSDQTLEDTLPTVVQATVVDGAAQFDAP